MGSNRTRGSRTSFFESLESRCLMSAVPSLDLSFGDNGTARPGVIYYSNGFAPALAMEPDGKILVSAGANQMPGSDGADLLLLNSDGSVDTTFNSGAPAFAAKTIYIQSDGKIVVAGTDGPFDSTSTMYRLNADGSVDTTFGVNGAIALPFIVQAVTDAPQGGLLVAGASGANGMQLAVMHLNSDGSVDTAYGTAGTATFDGNGHIVSGSGATLLIPTPDGKVILVGQENSVQSYPLESSGWLLARLNADGTVDSTFNGGQVVHYEANSYAVPSDAKLLPDGSILIAANEYDSRSHSPATTSTARSIRRSARTESSPTPPARTS